MKSSRRRRVYTSICLGLAAGFLTIVFFEYFQTETQDASIWKAEKEYYADEGLFPLAVGSIAGEEGVFVEDVYQGMAVHVQTLGAQPGQTLMLMLSDTARVYPREYICSSECNTLKNGYVSWSEYTSLTHKQDCENPETNARVAYCSRQKKERQFTFWGTMEQKAGNTNEQILGEVKVVVEE
jgi:hypothetical protein